MNELYERDLRLIISALKDLNVAVEELRQQTYPHTRLPRYKLFRFTKKISWPFIDDKNGIWVRCVQVVGCTQFYLDTPTHQREVAERCLHESGRSPAAVLRTLRNIQAATAWCRARAEGRRRAAQEILRQGQKALEALEAEAALRSLSL